MSLEYDYINLPGNHLVGSYADDMSSVTVHETKKEVEKEFKTVNNLTKECTRASGLSINTKKTFTFGSQKIQKTSPWSYWTLWQIPIGWMQCQNLPSKMLDGPKEDPVASSCPACPKTTS